MYVVQCVRFPFAVATVIVVVVVYNVSLFTSNVFILLFRLFRVIRHF